MDCDAYVTHNCVQISWYISLKTIEVALINMPGCTHTHTHTAAGQQNVITVILNI